VITIDGPAGDQPGGSEPTPGATSRRSSTLPACAQLLDAAVAAGEISSDIDAYALMLGIGNLCVSADNDPRYDARRMVELLIAGLGQSHST
jgi:hypothetical protein